MPEKEKTERLKRAMTDIHDTAKVKDATQLRGKVKIVTSSTILKLINEIVDAHTGESHKEMLSKLTETEFDLLKTRKSLEIIREDLQRAREEGARKGAEVEQLTTKLAKALDAAGHKEKEARRLSEMVKALEAEHASQMEKMRSSMEDIKSKTQIVSDPAKIEELRKEISALQNELRMSEEIEDMQRSELANVEAELERERTEHENQITGLIRKMDDMERALRRSRDIEKKLRAKLSQIASQSTEKLEKPEDHFTRRVIQLGYCDESQVREAQEIRESIAKMGLAPPKLQEVLIEKGYLTPEQSASVMQIQGGTKFGIEGYDIISKLGEGLLGTTYKAKQLSLDREVTIKVIRREFCTDKHYVEQILGGTRQAGKLHHKNIARVIDAGRIDQTYYCITEFVRGQNLRDVLRKKGVLAERQVLHIGLEVAAALAEARQHGLMHGDVKPSNIIVTTEGVVKLCDFGLIKPVNLKTSFNLPKNLYEAAYYTSPETARGDGSDIRSDIYSLGATLYHLISGGYPFGVAGSPEKALKAHISREVPDIKEKDVEISSEAAGVIMRMLRPRARDRYQEPGEIVAALTEVIKQVRKRGSTRRPAVHRRTRRRFK